MVELSKLQATTELVHVIKQFDMYLKRHTNGNNKGSHIRENLLCKNKSKCFSFIWNGLSSFGVYFIWPPSTLICIFQASNLRNKKKWKVVSCKPTLKTTSQAEGDQSRKKHEGAYDAFRAVFNFLFNFYITGQLL